jgi:hypothetical protein
MFVGRTEAHDILDAGTVVPAAVEDDDFASGREMLDVALEEDLGLVPIGRSGKGDDPEHARADLLGDCLDGAALAGGIAAFEQDDGPQLLLLDPLLQMTELDLELA